MGGKNNKPALRFQGYNDEWEQRRLGDAFMFLQNNTLPRAELSSDGGVARNIHYGDVLVRFGGYLDASSESLPFVTSREVLDKFKGSLLHDGDVVMADTAEDETVGKCTEVAGLRGFPAISGLHTIPLRAMERFAPGFLGYYLNSDAYHCKLLPLMQGIKVTSISRWALQSTDIVFPKDISEQSAIGRLFIQLDRLSALHQRKYDQLVNVKKSMLRKMFPQNGRKVPEIRFKGFTGEWEQQELGEAIYEFYNGQTPYRQTKEYWDGTINWLSSGDLNRGIVTHTIEKITEKGRQSTGLRIMPKGTMVIAIMGLEAAGTRGNCGILGVESTINQACMALITDEKVLSTEFLFQWYQCFGDDYALKITQGTKQQNYNSELLGRLSIFYPSITEQKAIGRFLSSVDSLISLHMQKLEILKNIKKSMLEKMFV